MDQCEDREEGVPPSKTTLCGEHESQTKAQRNPPGPGPGPGPSCVSLKRDTSKDEPINFKVQRAPAAERTDQGSESNIPENGSDCLSVNWDSPRNRNSMDPPPSFATDIYPSCSLRELDQTNNNLQE